MEYIGTIKDNYMFTNIVNTDRWFDLEDLPSEIWEDIEGYEGSYQISNKGRVKSLSRIVISTGVIKRKHTKTKILKVTTNGLYYGYSLSKNGNTKNYRLHGLLLTHFVENLFDKPFCNHKDGNKLNNDLSNLEWVTCKENYEHACKLGLVNIDSRKPIYCKNINMTFNSIIEFAKYLIDNNYSKTKKVRSVVILISRNKVSGRNKIYNLEYKYLNRLKVIKIGDE